MGVISASWTPIPQKGRPSTKPGELQLAKLAVLVNSLIVGHGSKRTHRFTVGDYRLGEPELLALLTAADEDDADSQQAPPADRAVESLIQVIDILVGIQELSDKHFRGSSHRAVQLARAMAEQLGLPHQEVTEIALAALLKDVGPLGVEDGLLEDSGIYSSSQRSRMHEHVVAGVACWSTSSSRGRCCRSSATTTSVTTVPATRTASRVRRFRWAHGS